MGKTSNFRFAFAGDRDVAVNVLRFLVESGFQPSALMLPNPDRASHSEGLRSLCNRMPEERVLVGAEFRETPGKTLLSRLELDVVIVVHFPHIVPEDVLSVSKMGWLNLHPAYLPYNRGWHTPSWAILDGTPAGATLHFMDTGVDTGDIIARSQVAVGIDDTADSLYRKVKNEELLLFESVWPRIVTGTFETMAQEPDQGTTHRRLDLLRVDVQRLDLNARLPVQQTLRKLRALTTNDLAEAAYFEVDGQRFRVRVEIQPDDLHPD